MSPRVLLGVDMSAVKGIYKQRAAESGRKRTITPYAFCFNVIVDWMLTDITIGRAVHDEGVAFILETGNEHNAEAEQVFYDVRQRHGLENVLRSISFVGKESCRAIQIADLLAFYSRRNSVAMEKAHRAKRPPPAPEAMMTLISQSVPHRGFVATDFDQHLGLPSWRPPF